MAGFNGSQDFWIVGSRFYFEPNITVGGARVRSGYLIDLGTVDVISPSVSASIAELKDSEAGVVQLVDQALTQIDETYAITVRNFNMYNLRLLFGGYRDDSTTLTGKVIPSENQPTTPQPRQFNISREDFAKTASAITSGNSLKPSGGVCLIQLRGGDGRPIRNAQASSNITITALNCGTSGAQNVALTKDINWRWWDPAKGIIRFLGLTAAYNPTGTGATVAISSAGALTTFPAGGITCNVASLTNGLGYGTRRTIYPQSIALGDLTGTAHIYWTRNNGADVSARWFPCSISNGGSALSSDDYSSWTLNASVLTTGLTTLGAAGQYNNIMYNNSVTEAAGFLPGETTQNEGVYGLPTNTTPSGWEVGGEAGGGGMPPPGGE